MAKRVSVASDALDTSRRTSVYEDAAQFPHLLDKWARCKDVICRVPDSAFLHNDELPWLAILISDHMDYNSLALCVADGLISSTEVLLQELEREFRKELIDEIDNGQWDSGDKPACSQ